MRTNDNFDDLDGAKPTTTTVDAAPLSASDLSIPRNTIAAAAAAHPAGNQNPGSESSILALRLTQDFDQIASGKLLMTDVPVGKPRRESFFRAHPEHQSEFWLVSLEQENYIVAPNLVPMLPGLARRVRLYVIVTVQGVVHMVPVPLADDRGVQNQWHVSLERALLHARRSWIRLNANMSKGAYDVYEALGNLGEPAWPDEPFGDLLEIAFRDRVVRDREHPVVQQLLGAA